MIRDAVRRARLAAAASIAILATVPAAVASAETADEFVARLNKEFADIALEVNAAGWTQATYINVDTQLLNARAFERYLEVFSRAVAQAKGEYLLFLDGDCVPLPDFVSRHKALADPRWFVAGNRILLSPSFTAQALQAGWALHARSGWHWLWARLRGQINRLTPLLRLGNAGWRKVAPLRWQGARTCNLAVWREDFVAVNGFDEAYAGWGHEDADLAVRLIRQGTRRKDGRFATAVLHLWHRENDRSREQDNAQRLAHILQSTHTRASQGLDQYLTPSA